MIEPTVRRLSREGGPFRGPSRALARDPCPSGCRVDPSPYPSPYPGGVNGRGCGWRLYRQGCVRGSSLRDYDGASSGAAAFACARGVASRDPGTSPDGIDPRYVTAGGVTVPGRSYLTREVACGVGGLFGLELGCAAGGEEGSARGRCCHRHHRC